MDYDKQVADAERRFIESVKDVPWWAKGLPALLMCAAVIAVALLAVE